MTSPFYVSAPGKVILFGEHSTVYGKPAIAAALGLRAYLLVVPNEDPNQICLEFPDISLKHSWNRQDIPWGSLQQFINRHEGKPVATDELIPEILDNLSDLLDMEDQRTYITCRCFMYLYSNLCSPDTPGCHFVIRSTLPIGAGLGSSASVSVSISTALAILGKHIEYPTIAIDTKHHGKGTPDSNFIDAWSLMGEKCFHGNPSGIDNAVATHGGAVMYQRFGGPGNVAVRTNLRNFTGLDLLLTNTKIPRSTADLVGGVAALTSKYNKAAENILSAMGEVAMDAYDAMLQPTVNTNVLSELFNINHGLLVALGVSHPALETIKAIGDSHKIGATKLTGAGGGGCAITLLSPDVESSTLDRVKKEYEAKGFETFQAQLGGKGVGVLQFENNSEPEMFSAVNFMSQETREHIEEAIGASKVAGWRFW
ncbi:mevalonate kinase [Candidozyma auris]|nr:mevalonate kinase [[Candida] auris]